jgi:protein TonB
MGRRFFDQLLDSDVAGKRTRNRTLTVPVSIGIHAAVLLGVIVVPLLLSNELPEPATPALRAFLVEAAAPPPPPPPPPPPAPPKAALAPKVEKPKVVNLEKPVFTAPIEIPHEVKQEAVDTGSSAGVASSNDGGVEGGVDGGVKGGVVGGVVGGVLGGVPESKAEPPPTPEPKPEPPAGPVRVGGKIHEPKKVRNVAPQYPEVAKQARVEGVVVLECTISATGHVTDVRVLKGIPLLDAAALDAVRQWSYTPTLLNGTPVPVIMTVTVNFKLAAS